MTYSIDFRRKILEIREAEKLSLDECSKRFKVGRATIFRWTKRIHPKLTRNKPATKLDMKKLKEDIEKYSDAYLSERAKRLGVCISCIWYALKRLAITYKKNSAASET
jgi:transposase